MRNIKDLTGQKFGKLTIIRLDEKRIEIEKQRVKNGEITKNRIFWICNCDCGKKNISVSSKELKSGKTKSCGCYNKEKDLKINEYEFLENEVVKGWDTKHNNYFLIDKKDYEVVKKYCWRFDSGYWVANSKGDFKNKNIKLHQLIMMQIDNTYETGRRIVPDHLNRNTSDNRRCNLKLKTQSENMKNLTITSTNESNVVGVIHRNNSWIAQIQYNNKKYSKSFKNLEEAIEQRLKWEKEFGFTIECIIQD